MKNVFFLFFVPFFWCFSFFCFLLFLRDCHLIRCISDRSGKNTEKNKKCVFLFLLLFSLVFFCCFLFILTFCQHSVAARVFFISLRTSSSKQLSMDSLISFPTSLIPLPCMDALRALHRPPSVCPFSNFLAGSVILILRLLHLLVPDDGAVPSANLNHCILFQDIAHCPSANSRNASAHTRRNLAGMQRQKIVHHTLSCKSAAPTTPMSECLLASSPRHHRPYPSNHPVVDLSFICRVARAMILTLSRCHKHYTKFPWMDRFF